MVEPAVGEEPASTIVGQVLNLAEGSALLICSFSLTATNQLAYDLVRCKRWFSCGCSPGLASLILYPVWFARKC